MERAFALFTERIGDWWPAEFTWSQDVLDDLRIEPREGGLCTELGPRGFRCDWGAVLAWERPCRLLLAWQIAPSRAPEPNPARASEVEVRFEQNGDASTAVELEHRHFERHGDGAREYRDGMHQGWERLLERYAAFAGAQLSGMR